MEKEVSRKYKFRGKDLKTGEWLYGDLVHSADGKRTGILVNDRYCYDECEVYPNTVCEFIDKLDKNKNEIYEGDIVLCYDDIKDKLVLGYVAYNAAWCSFCIVPFNFKIGDPVSLCPHWEYEVVGNIHDNLEVIKK